MRARWMTLDLTWQFLKNWKGFKNYNQIVIFWPIVHKRARWMALDLDSKSSSAVVYFATAAEDKNNSCFDTQWQSSVLARPFLVRARHCARRRLAIHYAFNGFVYFPHITQQFDGIFAQPFCRLKCVLSRYSHLLSPIPFYLKVTYVHRFSN